MRLRFYIDPVSGEPHIYEHNVDEDEARQIIEAPGEDRPGRDGTRVAVGQTDEGRYLRVIYAREEEGTAFVITAMDLTGKPLIAYRRRRRRKKGMS